MPVKNVFSESKKEIATLVIDEINKKYFTKKLEANQELLKVNFFANNAQKNIRNVLEANDDYSIKKFFKENDINDLIWKEEIIDYLIKTTIITKEQTANLDFRFVHSGLNEWSFIVECFYDNKKSISSKKIYFAIEFIRNEEFIFNHVIFASICFLSFANISSKNNFMPIINGFIDRVKELRRDLLNINSKGGTEINDEEQGKIANICKNISEMRDKLKIILFQKKIISELLNYFASAKYFLNSNNITLSIHINAETHPEIYQKIQSLYPNFLNIYKNNVLLKYPNIREDITFMNRFVRTINNVSIINNSEEQFFENLKITDLRKELQGIDSFNDNEIDKIISPQEVSSFNNHIEENGKQLKIVLSRLFKLVEINIFKINNLLNFIKENYPVNNQNYQQTQMLTHIDVIKYLKELNEVILTKRSLIYAYTFELKIENEFKELINKLNFLSKNKEIIGTIFLKIIKQIQILFSQYCENINKVEDLEYKQELIRDIEEKLEATKQVLTTKIIKYSQILLLITDGKFSGIKPLELYHKINLLLFYQEIQDLLLVENKNITNNNILTNILFATKRNDNEDNTEIGKNIKALETSVNDYSEIIKKLEKFNNDKKDTETTIQEITKAIKDVSIELTAINNVIQGYEWNFSRLREKNNREIITLQRNIEEVKEQIKTEQEKIKNLEINNKEQEIFINDNASHPDKIISRKKIIDLNQQKLQKIMEIIDINEQEIVIKEIQIVVLTTEIKTNKNKIDDNLKKVTEYKNEKDRLEKKLGTNKNELLVANKETIEELEKAKTEKFNAITLLNNSIKDKIKEFQETENFENGMTQNLLVKEVRRINFILTEFYNIQKNHKISNFFDKVWNVNIFPSSIPLISPETMSKNFNLAQIMNKIIFTPLKTEFAKIFTASEVNRNLLIECQFDDLAEDNNFKFFFKKDLMKKAIILKEFVFKNIKEQNKCSYNNKSNFKDIVCGSLIKNEKLTKNVLTEETISQTTGYICVDDDKEKDYVVIVPIFNEESLADEKKIIYQQLVTEIMKTEKYKKWAAKTAKENYETKFFFGKDFHKDCLLFFKINNELSSLPLLVNISARYALGKRVSILTSKLSVSSSQIKPSEMKKLIDFTNKKFKDKKNIHHISKPISSLMIELILKSIYENIWMLDDNITDSKDWIVKNRELVVEKSNNWKNQYQKIMNIDEHEIIEELEPQSELRIYEEANQNTNLPQLSTPQTTSSMVH